jgi:50S ribosomal subunit-associated GTPase HflX
MGASRDAAIVVAINKVDIATPSDALQQFLAKDFATVLFVSGLTGEGIRALFVEVANGPVSRPRAVRNSNSRNSTRIVRDGWIKENHF